MRWIGWLFGRKRAQGVPDARRPHEPVAAERLPGTFSMPQDEAGDAGEHWTVRLAAMALPAQAPAPDPRLLPEVEVALLQLVHERARLPRRPQLLPQLLGLLNDERASGRQIAEVIGRDPALAANLLRLANSPMYRVQSAMVESLDRAVALVGTEGLRQLVAVALMQPVMRLEGGATGSLPERVWEHTELATGLVARSASGRGRDAVFAAQLLALMQGLGAIMVVQALRDACARLQCQAPDATTTAELLQRWARRIGQGVSRAWDLPAVAGVQDVAGVASLEALLETASSASVDIMLAGSEAAAG